MCGKEAYDTFLERLRTAPPLPAYQLLRLCGKMVHQIQTEHEEVFREPHHLFLIESQEVHIRQRMEIMGITLVVAEDTFLLQDIWCRHLVHYSIAVLIAEGLDAERAINQEIEITAWIAHIDHLPSRRHLLESETGVTCDNLQIVTAHALEQRELKQFVVYLQDGHYFSILSCREGENHTAKLSLPSS